MIVKCPQLKIKFPTTEEECVILSNDFAKKSASGAITNCIGAIDGYLMKIYTPSKIEAGNVRSFFSGHYQCHGVNIQAVCDAHSRFIFLEMAAPGSWNDRDAIKETAFPRMLDKIPEGFVIIGDAAYESNERLVSMYHGAERLDPKNDNFNYYASQCRIRIEMAFGLMQMKFGILWRPLRVKIKNMRYVILAIGNLHNFVINERLLNSQPQEELITNNEDDLGYLPTELTNDMGDPIVNNTSDVVHTKGQSQVRDWMTNQIFERRLVRPEISKRNLINSKNL